MLRRWSGTARRSTLLPRQALEAPAGEGVPLVPVVQFAFEPVDHVVHARETRAFQLLARLLRAVAAAADEGHRARRVVGAGELLHLADEMRVHCPVRAVVPRDVQRADRMADEQVLHLAAAIDE